MSFLADLASKKGSGWLNTIEHAYQILGRQNVSQKAFIDLVNSCATPDQLALLAREFFRFSQHDPQGRSGYSVFITEVDDSDYALSDWVEAVACLYNWLKENKKTLGYLDVLNYLNCCSQAPDNLQFHHSLVEITTQMLKEHGVELAQDIES